MTSIMLYASYVVMVACTSHSPLSQGSTTGNALTQSIFLAETPRKEGRERHPSANAVKHVKKVETKKQKRHVPEKNVFWADLAGRCNVGGRLTKNFQSKMKKDMSNGLPVTWFPN